MLSATKNVPLRFFSWRGVGLIIFLAAQMAFSQAKNISVMEVGRWRVEYDLANGVADIFCDGKILIPRAYAVVKLPETVTSMDYQSRKVSRTNFSDGFGSGVKITVESSNGDTDKMIQTFWLYQKADYILADVKILRKSGAKSNFMSPLTTESAVFFPPYGDNRALAVPFDNDKWIRYNAIPFGTNVTSHEVSAFYNNANRQGLVIGSVEHDVWKTGIKLTTASNVITGLQIFGGLASDETRDVLPHGIISGEAIKSPKIFIGNFSDWRNGLETFARANAIVTPARAWTNGVPFGWNSWGKLQHKISFDKAIQVSDYIAKELQPNHFENHGVVYVGLDSGWTRLNAAQLKAFVDHCHTNGQEAGVYFTPFAAWRQSDDAVVEGTDYKFRDLYLYANGQKQLLDGGVALDPTHPGTRQRIEHIAAQFKQAGFKYVKLDFLTHGALEADSHFDPQVTTGIQAYNSGMKFVRQTLGEDVYLNEAISPLFPAQYANSRRIACDAFGDIDKIEYTLNALTYGWWLAQVYDYNDPDHVVLDGYSEGENRARVTSAVISGLFLSGDDFSAAGSAAGKARAKLFLTNKDINELAIIGRPFHPVEGDSGSSAANYFVRSNRDDFFLVAFNYSNATNHLTFDFKRIGLSASESYKFKELWGGEIFNATNGLTISLKPADAAVYKITRLNVE